VGHIELMRWAKRRASSAFVVSSVVSGQIDDARVGYSPPRQLLAFKRSCVKRVKFFTWEEKCNYDALISS
jgi:hypothetical protein